MRDAIHVGLSTQVTMQRRLETLANNVANMNTVGFRAERVRFEEAMKEIMLARGE